jgi:hypothetical protein
VANLFDLASICSYLYNPGNTTDLPTDAGGWTVLRNIYPNPKTNNADGFYAEAFKNVQTGEIVIAIRGTVPSLPEGQNLLEDLQLARQGDSKQAQALNAVAEEAIAFAKQVEAANPGATITLTGHSLGGYAAEAALVRLTEGGASNVSAVTFNAPGLPAWFLGNASPSSFDCYNFNTWGDIVHTAGGIQIGQSTTLDVGPSPAQEMLDYAKGFAVGDVVGVGAGEAAGIGYLAYKDWFTAAHTIGNFVGTNSYTNQPGIFSANANSLGAETAQEFFADGQQIPQPPQLTTNPDGAISLSDGAGDVVGLQYVNGNLQTSLMAGSGLGVSDLSGLESELQADGSTIVPPDLLNAGVVSLAGGSSLFGTLSSGLGGDTSAVVGSEAPDGSSGLPGQLYVPDSTSANRYECNIPVSGSVSEVIDSNGFGTVWVNSTLGYGQLTGGSPVQGTPDTWKDSNGTQYVFSGSPNSDIGTLTISGGLLGSDPANSVTIQNFNLAAAATSAGGFLGIQLGYAISLAAGTGASSGSSATFPAGSEQSYTLSVDAPNAQAETITVTLSGASPSDFDLDIGDECEQLNSNTFTVTLPAGERNVSFGLIDVTATDGTSDIAGGATLTLTASVTNPADSNGSPIKSSPLSITYTPEPQNTAAGPQGGDPIAGKYDSVTGITTYQGDGGDDFISAGQGPNRILAHNSGGDSIVGGSGRNTIDGGSGNDAIGVNGMPDLVLLVERFNARNDVTGADLIRTQGTDSRTTDANAITFRSLPLGICFVRAIAALLLGLATVVFPLCSAVQAANLAPCIRKYVRFDGSEPLQFDRVTGLPGTRLYIHASYPKSCNSSTSSCAGGHAYLLPGDTVAIGKTCGHWTYMQYIGVSRITKGWVDGSRLNFLKKVGTGEGTPLFTLTRGRGKPVCEAYLQRLNVTQSNYCTMPESDAIPGFSVLHRVPLRASTMVKMSGRVFEWWEHPDPHLNGSWNGTLRAVGTVMEAWRYNPPIDVNNDGRPDNIIVWQGYGLQDGVTFCGEPFTRFYNWGYRPRRLPLIMSSRSHIDAEETALVFGRPGRGLNRGRRLALGEMPFKPVGHFITPFKYRGVTYFSTFFDVTGDYRGLRKNQPKLANVLGVLLRRDHNTREVCEYKMAGSDYPPENAQPSGLISAQE